MVDKISTNKHIKNIF